MYPECFIRDVSVYLRDADEPRGYLFHTDDDGFHYYYDYDTETIYIRLEDLTTLVRIVDRCYLFDFIVEGKHEV